MGLARASHAGAHLLDPGVDDQGSDDVHGRLHRPGSDEHLGEKHLSGLEAAPDLLQRWDHPLIRNEK